MTEAPTTSSETWIDTHAHLDGDEFADDLDDVLRRAHAAGVNRIVCPAIGAASSRRVLELAASRPSLAATVGIHPNCIEDEPEDAWETVVELAETHRDRIVALGETGLDWYRPYTPRERQIDFFRRHLELGARLDLPVIIHCREADDTMLPLLQETMQRRPFRGIMHACAAPPSLVREYAALGLFISFAGPVTFTNKSCEPLRESARIVPEDQLLVETDSPYLTPMPHRGKIRRNEPGMVVHTGRFIASLRNTTAAALAAITTHNACRVFGWEMP
ncbi:MAG: TatD family deoxyribonuclease [Planctomycetota bacterium]|nr:MAG: TatD family deoxyribonuclease [Planctomycetota bacterium]